MIIKVGTRKSPLALAQVDEIQQLLKAHSISLNVEKVLFETKGDEDKKTSLTAQPADDFFTDTIEAAQLNGEVDISIHSAKDLPKELKKGLVIAALTKSIDETDAFLGRVKFEDLQEGARVGTSSRLRQSQIKALNSSLETVDIRGTIEERIALIDKGVCDGIVVATAALKRLGLAHLIKNIMPWEGTPLQGQVAVVVKEQGKQLLEIFSALDVRKDYGKVLLVGAGPGDPDLITVKGSKALNGTDCVFYDYLVDKRLLQYATQAEHIFVGKRKGSHTLAQHELSTMIRKKVQEGKNVVRLKGGDPLIFGRGADEINYLNAYHIDVEVIPGLSSATSIPSRLGIPLTARDVSSSVAFLSGHGKEECSNNPQPLVIPKAETLIFLMGITKLKEIIHALLKEGWKKTTPVIIISNGTRPEEKIVAGTLDNIESEVLIHDIKPPALIMVGETVKFYRKPSQESTRILYTGTNPSKYSSFGNIVHWPMIQIEKADIPQEQMKALTQRLSEYDIIIFTSRFGVEYFYDSLKSIDFDIAQLQKKLFAVIGEATYNTLLKHGFNATIMAEVETARGLLEVLKKKTTLNAKRVLFPRSALPNPFLKSALENLGASVDEVVVYQNIKPAKKDLPALEIDKVMFTSPSTVSNFLEDYQAIPKSWKIIAKGPVTQEALKEAGYESEVLIED